MESIREGDAISIIGSVDNFSTFYQPVERKDEINVPEDHSSKLSLIAEALNETIAESNAQNREITELLGQLDIETKTKPKVIQDTYGKVAAVLRAEGLLEMDEIALRLKMEQKKRESKRIARENRMLKSRYEELCERHSVTIQKENKARESVKSLQQCLDTNFANNEEEYANRIFMGTKLNDYTQTADKIEESLRISEDYYPDKILEKYNVYLKLVEELNSLDKSLSKYGDLPTNLSEARLKVEEKERYVKDLERALFEKMK